VEKVIDVVGLYLAAPKGALVICVDERVLDEHGRDLVLDPHSTTSRRGAYHDVPELIAAIEHFIDG
jgi:hypothetical protein